MPELEEVGINYSAAAVTLVTTAETVVISSGRVPVPRQTCQVLIRAQCVLATGAGTTTVTPRIRRGTTTAGTEVGVGIAQEVKAAAGSKELFAETVMEERQNVDSVEYSFTLAQASASGNGAAAQLSIQVEILGG